MFFMFNFHVFQDPELALASSSAAYLEGEVVKRIDEVRSCWSVRERVDVWGHANMCGGGGVVVFLSVCQ